MIREGVHPAVADVPFKQLPDRGNSDLKIYGFTSVIYLAQRVGLDLGFRQVVLPPIREGAESRFASFLSQHVLWYEDPLLDGWLGFLDDYQVLRGEEEADKKVFSKFLKTEQRKFTNEATLWGFVAGADRFLTRIADLSDSLSEEEKPSYGLFYAYWMAKSPFGSAVLGYYTKAFEQNQRCDHVKPGKRQNQAGSQIVCEFPFSISRRSAMVGLRC